MTIFNWATSAGSWNTATDWTPFGIPGTADNVVFATSFAKPYVASTGTQSADIVNSVSIIGDSVTLSGAIDTQTLAIEGDGRLALDYYGTGTAIYAGTLAIGPTGGSLNVPAQVYLEDNVALIDGAAGAAANVTVADSPWVNLTGITLTGPAAELYLEFGTLTTGPQGLLVSNAATFVQDGTIEGAVTLAGGTLEGGSGSLTLDGIDNTIFGIDSTQLGPVSDGTLAGGFTSDGPVVVLGSPGHFSGGVTLAAGTLDLAAAGAAGTGAIIFAPNAAATLRIEEDATPTNLIENFAAGDTIDLPWLSDSLAPTITDTGGTITVALPGRPIEATLTLGGVLSDLAPTISSDGSSGTAITLPLIYQATGSSGSWTTPGVWSPSGVPDTGEFAVLSAAGTYAISVDGTQSIAGLTLDNPGADLVVNNDGTLLASLGVDLEAGTLTVNGDLVAGTLAIDNATVLDSGNLPGQHLNYQSQNYLLPV